MKLSRFNIRFSLAVSVLAAAIASQAGADELPPPMPPDTEQAPDTGNEQPPTADHAPPAGANESPPGTDSAPADPQPSADQPPEPQPTAPEPMQSQPTEPQPTVPMPMENQPSASQPAENPSDPGAPVANPQSGFLAHVSVDHEDGVYREGEKLSLRFVALRASHVYLIYHQADKTSWLVFPNKGRPANLLAPNEQVSIPAPGDSFRFRVRAPFGEETLQVVCSTRPIEELDNLDISTGRSPQVSSELIATLHDRIARQPAEFGEHRVPLHTHAGNPSTPPSRKLARLLPD